MKDASPSLKLASLRILLLEDNAADAELTLRALRAGGFSFEHEMAGSLAEFRRYLEAPQFDIVLSDFTLPDGTAADVLSLLQQTNCQAPLLLVTGSLDDEAAVAFIKRGGADYVLKDGLTRLPWAVRRALADGEARSARLRAEAASRQSEMRFGSLVENLDAIVWEADPHTLQFNFVSRRAEHILGFPAGQWSTPDFWVNHLHPEDRDRTVAYCLAATASGQDHQLEYRMMHAKGHPVWLRDFAKVQKDARGEIAGLSGVMVDITERKRSEAALRFMQFAIDRASDGVLWVRSDASLAYVNDAFCRLTGYTRPELLAIRAWQFDPAQTPEKWRQQWDAVRMAGGVTLEKKLATRGGGTVDVELVVNHVEFEGNEFHCTFVRDITSRRAAEQQLRLQAAALESAANAIVVTDNTGRIEWVNPAFTFLTGYTTEEVLGRSTRLLRSGVHDEEFYRQMWAIILSGRVWFGEMVNRRKDGTLYTEEMTITPVTCRDGAVTHFIAVKQDISSRKLAERKLRESEARLRGLFENAAHGICRVAGDARFLEVNPALVRMLGYGNAKELLPLSLPADIYRHREDFQRIHGAITASGRISGEQAEWKRQDGTFITVRLNASALRNAAGEVQEIEQFVEDITEKQALEKQLTAAQKFEAIGRLAGGIAHDFNNVLGAILGWAELSESLVPPDSKLLRNLRTIEEQARRGAGLTQQLLAFARRQQLAPRVLDLNQCVADVANLLEQVIGKDIELHTNLDPRLSTVRADATQVEQVLMNLCVNARDAMPRGGQLTIATRNAQIDEEYCRTRPYTQPGNYVQITVTDTGEGMSEDTLQHIFEPFFTTKEKGKGTGLGLATVYGIVKQHGGFIHVYSEPGIGTTFRVYFPVADGVVHRMPPRPQVEVRGGSETILLAEDHGELGQMALQTLQGLGYRVIHATDGDEALRLFRQHAGEIALVFMDVVMPRLSGPEAYEQMCKVREGVPAMFASGYSADVPALGAVLARGFPLLQKPYGMKDMARMLRELLDRKADAPPSAPASISQTQADPSRTTD